MALIVSLLLIVQLTLLVSWIAVSLPTNELVIAGVCVCSLWLSLYGMSRYRARTNTVLGFFMIAIGAFWWVRLTVDVNLFAVMQYVVFAVGGSALVLLSMQNSAHGQDSCEARGDAPSTRDADH